MWRILNGFLRFCDMVREALHVTSDSQHSQAVESDLPPEQL